jgi:prepilin-type N-terminal cleavage/methylation domain-containing protein
MVRRVRHPGFTLLELVLVMVIIGTVLAMAAPSLRGWSRGSLLRDTAEQFVAVTRLARTQAVSTCRIHRLNLDPAGSYYLTVQQGQEFIHIQSNFGLPFELPGGFRIQMVTTLQSGESYIDFYPTGRTQPARVRIFSDQGESMDIECATPAETFQVLSLEGASG